MVQSQNVLISGCSSGIGEAAARSLARSGWTVFAGVRSESDAKRLRQAHANIRPLTLDVTQQADIQQSISLIEDAVGDQGLQGLVNNAGIGYIAPCEIFPLEDFRYNFEVNVFGLLALTQAALPLLRGDEPHGRVINVGSIAGVRTFPYAASYYATKHALESLSDSLRHELRPSGVAVSLIRAGPINTQIFHKSAMYGRELLRKRGTDMDAVCRAGLADMAASAVKSGEDAVSTDQIVHVVTHVLTCPRPRARYYDSWQTAVKAKGLAWAPEFLLDIVVDRLFHTRDS